MEYAIDYVMRVKIRFANKPEIYRKFLDVLRAYNKKQCSIKEIFEEVSFLFEDDLDLLKDFTFSLPNSIQSGTNKELPANLLQKFASNSLND